MSDGVERRTDQAPRSARPELAGWALIELVQARWAREAVCQPGTRPMRRRSGIVRPGEPMVAGARWRDELVATGRSGDPPDAVADGNRRSGQGSGGARPPGPA